MDEIWEQLFATQAWGKYPPEHVIRFVAKHFYSSPDRKSVKLLEIGCGPGANVWYMAKEGFDVCGIDGSGSAIQHARDRLAREELSAKLVVGDFCARLPWPDDSFDGVLENVSLYANRSEAAKNALSEVHRVLKPGGKFQTCWFTPDTWGFGLGLEIEPGGFASISEGPLKDRGFCLFPDEVGLRELLAAFQIESIEKSSYTLCNSSRLVEQWVVSTRKP